MVERRMGELSYEIEVSSYISELGLEANPNRFTEFQVLDDIWTSAQLALDSDRSPDESLLKRGALEQSYALINMVNDKEYTALKTQCLARANTCANLACKSDIDEKREKLIGNAQKFLDMASTLQLALQPTPADSAPSENIV